MNILSKKEFVEVCEAHQEETWWYLFLNYGAPIDNPEFVKRFEAVRNALSEYAEFMNKEQKFLEHELSSDDPEFQL